MKKITDERLQELCDSPDYTVVRKYTKGYAGILRHKNQNHLAFNPVKYGDFEKWNIKWIGHKLKGRFAVTDEKIEEMLNEAARNFKED